MSEPVISVRNLRVEFATRRGVLRAIDGVSFDIARGEVLGVVGESGAGKSVTGSAIIGLIEPPGRIAGGEILLHGKRIDNLPPEEMRRIRGRKIAMIFQDPLTSRLLSRPSRISSWRTSPQPRSTFPCRRRSSRSSGASARSAARR
jgi:peptide/nickel transport system ATP-binding protein